MRSADAGIDTMSLADRERFHPKFMPR